jgi:cobalt-zinc-cadmium efflux system membrane fusion protein
MLNNFKARIHNMKTMINKKLMTPCIALLVVAGMVGLPQATAEVDPHAGHDHAKVPGETVADTLQIQVTKEQVQRLGIKISQAVKGVVRQEIRVPGEIKINANRVAHVVPRAAGIVREVRKTQGDRVKAGEILAWIESDELAEAKLDFYAKESEVGCCEIKLPRAKEIFENVTKLIALLKKEASEDAIHKLDKLEMGHYRGELLPAYAAYLEARATHKREAGLHAKQISSEQELIKAETTLRQARAKFQAAIDIASYETQITYSETAQEHQVAVFNSVAAEKLLRLKGAEAEVVEGLRKLIPKTAGVKPCECTDPNCKEGKLPSVAETLGKDERFAWYALRAPFDGTLIEKHIAIGESIETSAELFTIADLSSVWVDLVVSQESIALVKEGYTVIINMPDGTKTEAKTDYIAAVVDAATRTALARATLPNPDGQFRPGTFVDAGIRIPTKEETVVIPKDSVQSVNDHPCVFVWGKSAFEIREVQPGYADATNIEILKGLEAGEAVASVNAFHLKAEASKNGSGPTCSLGHAH